MAQSGIGATLIDRLKALLGPGGVELAAEQLRFFAEDALRGRGDAGEAATPLAVVRPATAAQTARVLAMASEARLPGVALTAPGRG